MPSPAPWPPLRHLSRGEQQRHTTGTLLARHRRIVVHAMARHSGAMPIQSAYPHSLSSACLLYRSPRCRFLPRTTLTPTSHTAMSCIAALLVKPTGMHVLLPGRADAQPCGAWAPAAPSWCVQPACIARQLQAQGGSAGLQVVRVESSRQREEVVSVFRGKCTMGRASIHYRQIQTLRAGSCLQNEPDVSGGGQAHCSRCCGSHQGTAADQCVAPPPQRAHIVLDLAQLPLLGLLVGGGARRQALQHTLHAGGQARKRTANHDRRAHGTQLGKQRERAGCICIAQLRQAASSTRMRQQQAGGRKPACAPGSPQLGVPVPSSGAPGSAGALQPREGLADT